MQDWKLLMNIKFDTEQWCLPLYFNRILTAVQNLNNSATLIQH